MCGKKYKNITNVVETGYMPCRCVCSRLRLLRRPCTQPCLTETSTPARIHRILIVEDDPLTACILSVYCVRLGWTPYIATGFWQAECIITESLLYNIFRYSCILVDIENVHVSAYTNGIQFVVQYFASMIS